MHNFQEGVIEYKKRGIKLNPSVPSPGGHVNIKYNGVLAKNGPEHIYAHVGYGENWSGVTDYRMKWNGYGYEVTVPVPKASTLNICFKDSTDNWDNNSGNNYIFDIDD